MQAKGFLQATDASLRPTTPRGTRPIPRHTQRRVLLIEDDDDDAERFRSALTSLRLESCCARRGYDGLSVVRQSPFDLILVDLDLPDAHGSDIARALRIDCDCPFIIVSREVDGPIATEAITLGARGVLTKPLAVHTLIGVIDSVLDLSPVRPAPQLPNNGRMARMDPPWPRRTTAGTGSVAERWAQLVLATIHADHDPKTINTWAKVAGVSRSALCECCRLVHIVPHDARDFGRLIRAISRSGEYWEPETVLDVADVRTLRKLLAKAGLPGSMRFTPTVREFLDRQHLIAPNNPALRLLCLLLLGEG